ncbi:MAG: DUF1801 domain-containing protein [Salibacteraceae bacterium]
MTQLTTNSEVAAIFKAYPDFVRPQMERLRQLILEAAEELEEIEEVEETLKWGEPSYLTRYGSTLRIDWKPKHSGQYAMYFQCTSQLVPTFRTVYNTLFDYEGNRALIFPLNETLPEKELKRCIQAGLRYHKVKKLPHLGL